MKILFYIADFILVIFLGFIWLSSVKVWTLGKTLLTLLLFVLGGVIFTIVFWPAGG